MITFQKGAGDNVLTYPLDAEQLDNLKPSSLASPRVGDSHGIDLPDSLKGDENLLKSAMEIVEVRSMVARNEFPREFMEKYYPPQWGEFPDETPEIIRSEGLSFSYPKGLANVVHMDNPMDFPNAALKYVLQNGGKCNQASDECDDFIEKVPETVRKLAEAIDRNLKAAFETKFYFGVPRPEEVIGFNITAYHEGSPNHPAFRAGHGAAAASVSVLMSRFEMSDEMIKELRDAAYVWAMARSLAGVHYGWDNLAGLATGGLLSEAEFNEMVKNSSI